jgi:glycosyltransferase involved in cell wall biosynthesis
VPWLVAQRRHYDVIFVSGFRVVGVTALLASKLFGKGCILKADSQGEMSGDFFTAGLRRMGRSPGWFMFRLFLWLRNRLLTRAHGFAAISDEIAGELAAHGVSPSKIHRIPNCVDTDRFTQVNAAQKATLRAKLGLPPGAFVAVYSGRLVSYKGLPLLLEVWRDTHGRHPEAHLVLVGTGSLDMHNCEAELRNYVNANDLAPWVTFTGPVSNVEEYLQAADMFVFPTENDVFPAALIEAMACGLPVISTPVGAIPSVIRHEQNGLLIEPGNWQQLSQAVDQLLSDRVLAERLGRTGRKTVQDRYSAGGVTQTYLALFESTAPSFRHEGRVRPRSQQETQ